MAFEIGRIFIVTLFLLKKALDITSVRHCVRVANVSSRRGSLSCRQSRSSNGTFYDRYCTGASYTQILFYILKDRSSILASISRCIRPETVLHGADKGRQTFWPASLALEIVLAQMAALFPAALFDA